VQRRLCRGVSNPAAAQAAQGAAGQAQGAAQGAAQNVSPADIARAAEAMRNTAWVILIGALVGLGASALGGLLGTRDLGSVRWTTRRSGA
jgi:hypothetical protein